MLLEINDWKFEVDEINTGVYSAAELAEHCTCGYCLNFYETVDRQYPDLRNFLKQFAVEIEAPDELMPYELGQDMCCDANYSVSGKILQFGSRSIVINGVEIFPKRAGELALCCHSPDPYFILSVGTMVLPWVLSDCSGEIIS